MLIRLSKGKQPGARKSMRLLKAITLAYQPLRVEEAGGVIGLTDEEGDIKTLLDQCASFIEVRGNRIAFVHESARDYLANENIESILESIENFGHGNMALSCVSHLTKMLRLNLVDLPRPDSTREFVGILKDEKRDSLLASVNYAATFLVRHLGNTTQTTIVRSSLTEKGAVHTFLRRRLLE